MLIARRARAMLAGLVLLKCYDAHFYIANWGSLQFALAFPEGCLDLKAIQSYLHGNDRYEEMLSIKTTAGRSIVWWNKHEEEGWCPSEYEGDMGCLVGIREQNSCIVVKTGFTFASSITLFCLCYINYDRIICRQNHS